MGITIRLVGIQPWDLEEVRRDPGLLDRDGDDRVTKGKVDLDKAWAGLHFLLTGEPEPGRTPATTPLQRALGGSEPPLTGTTDEVPPRVVGDDAVPSVKNALVAVGADELRRRFDPDTLVQADVYPPALWHQEDALDYLLEHFADLVWFYRRATALGWAVLVFTTL